MPTVLKGEQLIDKDPWVLSSGQDAVELADHQLLPIAKWIASEPIFGAYRLGAWVSANESIEPLAPFLGQIKLIAFEFAPFTDGRPFSQSYHLRTRYQYDGEIRACGHVLPDQVNSLKRVGFDTFSFTNKATAERALKLLNSISVHYQSDRINPLPLFHRR